MQLGHALETVAQRLPIVRVAGQCIQPAISHLRLGLVQHQIRRGEGEPRMFGEQANFHGQSLFEDLELPPVLMPGIYTQQGTDEQYDHEAEADQQGARALCDHVSGCRPHRRCRDAPERGGA